jgi:hypothetical protein
MKPIFFFLKNLPISTTAHNVFRSYFTPLMFAILTLSSCSSDDDNFSAADTAKIVGTYMVTDTDEDGDVESYSITISQSKDGGIEISNFGDIMYVPVKATIKGNMFTVPSQTFKGKSMTIVITGNGTLNDQHLNFNYSIDTGDGIVLEHSCVASKNV